jgi:hypothetical protein
MSKRVVDLHLYLWFGPFWLTAQKWDFFALNLQKLQL